MHAQQPEQLMIVLLASIAAIQSGSLAPAPSAQDMFVSCYLYVRDADLRQSDGSRTFSANTCSVAALAAIVNREGDRPDTNLDFCLPRNDPVVEADVVKAMAYAFLRFYRERGHLMGREPQTVDDGRTVFVVAQMAAWPCTSGGVTFNN